jgi:hypothetical protein
MASKLFKLHKVKISKSQTPLVNGSTLSIILSVGFVLPCAICTKMEFSTSLILTPKHFAIYGVMKEFVVLESKRQHTFLSLLTQYTFNMLEISPKAFTLASSLP